MDKHIHQPNAYPAEADAIIVGGGISGLYAGYRLKLAGFTAIVLEADAQTGGRVKSRPEKFTQLGLTRHSPAEAEKSAMVAFEQQRDQRHVARSHTVHDLLVAPGVGPFQDRSTAKYSRSRISLRCFRFPCR